MVATQVGTFQVVCGDLISLSCKVHGAGGDVGVGGPCILDLFQNHLELSGGAILGEEAKAVILVQGTSAPRILWLRDRERRGCPRRRGKGAQAADAPMVEVMMNVLRFSLSPSFLTVFIDGWAGTWRHPIAIPRIALVRNGGLRRLVFPRDDEVRLR